MTLIPTEEIRLVLVSAPLAFLLHVAVWRSFSPKAHLLWLVLTLILAPTGLFLFWMANGISWQSLLVPTVTHFLIVANYIAIYPAFQASSPTIQILNLLSQNRSGMGAEEICKRLAEEKLVKDRLSDLSQSGLITHDKGEVGLTPKGKVLASIFIFYRKLLSLPEGAG